MLGSCESKAVGSPSFLIIIGGLKGSSESVRVNPPLFLPFESPDSFAILLISKAKLYPTAEGFKPKDFRIKYFVYKLIQGIQAYVMFS